MESKTGSAKLLISSDKEHARCEVAFLSEEKWVVGWSRKRYTIKDKLTKLINPDHTQPVHILHRDMVYKMIAPITDYSAKYRFIS